MGPSPPASKVARVLARCKLQFKQDHRAHLPSGISRFLGYRAPGTSAPFAPLPFPPFTWLAKLPMKAEIWTLGWIGAFVGILLVESIMSTATAFREVYRAPTIVTSFAASAVLVFGVPDSPLAQPRNLVLGHLISALVGTAIARLFDRNPFYEGQLENRAFHSSVFLDGGLCMATSLLAQQITGNVHPPAGATGINAAVEQQIVAMAWNYLPTVLASSLIMLGWALIINNVGRRRYPVYWWAPEPVFVVQQPAKGEEKSAAEEKKVEQKGAGGEKDGSSREDVEQEGDEQAARHPSRPESARGKRDEVNGAVV